MENIQEIKDKDKKEFILLKDNNFYSLIVYIKNDSIFLKCLSYDIKTNINMIVYTVMTIFYSHLNSFLGFSSIFM